MRVIARKTLAAADYKRRIVFIKWVGAHADYDKIDAKTVQYASKTD